MPPPRYTVHRHPDAPTFLARAGAWLHRDEARYNLMIGLARRLLQSAEAFDPPLYLATVEGPDGLAGCALRTPPYKLLFTRLPPEALPALVADAGRVYEALPGVLGPPDEAWRLAVLWSQARGLLYARGMAQRIYRLDVLTPPAARPPGRLRPAHPGDLDLVTAWTEGFRRDTGLTGPDARATAARTIAGKDLFVWDDGAPRTMAAVMARTARSARVGYVYTPPEARGHGYASAAVAALSQRLFDEGLAFCTLYTDLANPTSNALYQRLGYYAVADADEYLFTAPAP